MQQLSPRLLHSIVVAVVSLLTQEITAIRAQTATAIPHLSCDNFKKRLESAATLLQFQMPTPSFQRVPTAGSDYWWISYPQRDVEADMSCRNGGFQEFEFYDYSVRTPAASVSHPQTDHLLAASLYAYTGWPSGEVLKGAAKLLESSQDGGNPGTAHLPNGAIAHLWIDTKTTGTAHLTIGFGGDELK